MSISKFRNVLLIVILFFSAMIILGVAYTIDNNWKFAKESAIQTDADILDIYANQNDIENGKIYKKARILVAYTVDGHFYTNYVRVYNKVLSVGQKTKVYFEKDDPYHLLTEPDYINALYTAAAIIFFAAVALIFFEPNIA